MNETKVDLSKEQDPVTTERQKLIATIFQNKDKMCSEYGMLVKHTGSLVSTSMVFAYNKAFNDIIKLLLKGDNNEETAKQA